jgi:hypothetical protein
MVITSFSISRDVETGADLPFSMSFQKIKTVKSEETQISVSPSGGAGGDQAAGTANVGNAGTNKIDSDIEMWRQHYNASGGRHPTREDFFDQWGEYP